MRLIDIESESFLNEMRGKQDACKNLINNSDNKTKIWTEREHWEGVYGVFVEMALTLKKQPTVDAAPVKHGKWGKTNNPSYSPFDGSSEHLSICSNCAYSREQHDFLYCPNCGAKMDLEVEQ